jgi:hypothetical protein
MGRCWVQVKWWWNMGVATWNALNEESYPISLAEMPYISVVVFLGYLMFS